MVYAIHYKPQLEACQWHPVGEEAKGKSKLSIETSSSTPYYVIHQIRSTFLLLAK